MPIIGPEHERAQRGRQTAAAHAGAHADAFLDYPGAGHLFTDASLPEEFDAASAELLWQRVLSFLEHLG